MAVRYALDYDRRTYNQSVHSVSAHQATTGTLPVHIWAVKCYRRESFVSWPGPVKTTYKSLLLSLAGKVEGNGDPYDNHCQGSVGINSFLP